MSSSGSILFPENNSPVNEITHICLLTKTFFFLLFTKVIIIYLNDKLLILELNSYFWLLANFHLIFFYKQG